MNKIEIIDKDTNLKFNCKFKFESNFLKTKKIEIDAIFSQISINDDEFIINTSLSEFNQFELRSLNDKSEKFLRDLSNNYQRVNTFIDEIIIKFKHYELRFYHVVIREQCFDFQPIYKIDYIGLSSHYVEMKLSRKGNFKINQTINKWK